MALAYTRITLKGTHNLESSATIIPKAQETPIGGDAVITLSDGWTVVTRDGLPSAHYELAIAITDSGTQILTLTSDDEYP